MNNTAKASVIIPAYNAAATLDQCIRACLAQTYGDFEVIVVDDGSGDDTARIASRYPVRYVRQENRGPAAARNRGAALAAGDILAFTDSDCVPAPTWLDALVRALHSGEFTAAGGAYAMANPDRILARMVHEEIAIRHERMNGQVDFLGSFNMAIRARVFHEIGGFDESFRRASAEDNDLAYRLEAAGRRLIFAPEAVVAHYHPTRLGPYLRTQARHGYWRVNLYRKHLRRARHGDRYAGVADLIRPPLAVLTLALLILILLCRGTPAAPAVGAVLGAVVALRMILGVRMPIAIYRRTKKVSMMLLYPRMAALRDYVRGLGMIWGMGHMFRRDRP